MRKSNIRFLCLFNAVIFAVLLAEYFMPELLYFYILDEFILDLKKLNSQFPNIILSIVFLFIFVVCISCYDLFFNRKYRSFFHKRSLSFLQILVLTISSFSVYFAAHDNMPSKTNIAILQGDVDKMLEELLEVDNVDNVDQTGLRPIEAAIMYYNNLDAAKILIELGADVNLPSKQGKILLTYARAPFQKETSKVVDMQVDEYERRKIIELLISN